MRVSERYSASGDSNSRPLSKVESPQGNLPETPTLNDSVDHFTHIDSSVMPPGFSAESGTPKFPFGIYKVTFVAFLEFARRSGHYHGLKQLQCILYA